MKILKFFSVVAFSCLSGASAFAIPTAPVFDCEVTARGGYFPMKWQLFPIEAGNRLYLFAENTEFLVETPYSSPVSEDKTTVRYKIRGRNEIGRPSIVTQMEIETEALAGVSGLSATKISSFHGARYYTLTCKSK